MGGLDGWLGDKMQVHVGGQFKTHTCIQLTIRGMINEGLGAVVMVSHLPC